MGAKVLGSGLAGPWRRFRSAVGVAVLVIAGVVGSTSVGAAALPLLRGRGVLPPHNPGRSLYPRPDFLDARACQGGKDTAACNQLVLAAVSSARRGLERMGPMRFNLAAYLRLSRDEQLFVTVNIERVARGLPPATALSRRLDAIAQQAARAGRDPSLGRLLGSRLAGGGLVIRAGGNWASGYDNPLGSDYGWMYYDGPGGGDGYCNATGTGCWGHRDNILARYGSPSQCPSHRFETVMGAGFVGRGVADGDSETELLVGLCGPPAADTVFTWKKAKHLLKIG